MSTATIEPKQEQTERAELEASIACPHCRKDFQPVVDTTQHPSVAGAKCPHCRLMVPAWRIEQILA